MDQKFLAGLGNIYANEILFHSKINPTRIGMKINNEEIKKLEKNTKTILKAMKKSTKPATTGVKGNMILGK